MIMETFGIPPSREVGIIKIALREAILEGIIANTVESGMPFLLAEGEKLGLMAVNPLPKPLHSHILKSVQETS